jgi:uncharacterized circularly permuted ATP-grasp superfamily protein
LNQAVLAGNVTLANSLGSGLVESLAFTSYLPQLAQAMLGEPLQMAGVATHWCGQPESLTYVLEHLDELTVFPAFRRRGRDGLLQRKLSEMTHAELADAIRATEKIVAS